MNGARFITERGNGHRVKTSSGWSAHRDDLDDVYVFSTNDSKTEHYD